MLLAHWQPSGALVPPMAPQGVGIDVEDDVGIHRRRFVGELVRDKVRGYGCR